MTYTEIIMSVKIKPTITVSDIAHLLARHTNLNYPNTYKPYDGMIADPNDMELIEDIKNNGKKNQLDFVVMGKTSDINNHDSGTMPHPMTGQTCILSLYDRLHEKSNSNSELRHFDNMYIFVAKSNTQVAEQFNN